MIPDLREDGIIVPTHSPYNAPVWPVKKSNGKWQLTVDYRKLSAYTAPLTAAVPNIAELIATIQEHAHPILATIDVKNTFFMVSLQESDQECFAFIWKGIQYTFTLSPQGYRHSPTLAHYAQIEHYSLSRETEEGTPKLLEIQDPLPESLNTKPPPSVINPVPPYFSDLTNAWFTNASAKREGNMWKYRAVALWVDDEGDRIVSEGEGSAQVGELVAFWIVTNLKVCNQHPLYIYTNSYAVFKGCTL